MMFMQVPDTKQIPSFIVDVFYGQINFREQSDLVQLGEQNPLIAISTSYDSLAISPELSVSLERGGSGFISELVISKLFSSLA